MATLSTLKEWLTIDEAVKQLSIELNEDVSKADIYRLALDRKLTLSVYFPNGAQARLGKIVDYDLAEKIEVQSLDGNETVTLCNALRIDDPFLAKQYDFLPALLLEDEITQIIGIWDMPMVGGEKLDIKHAHLQEISNLEYKWLSLDGTFAHSGERWASLQVEGVNGSYYAAGGLEPFDHILVIRQKSLVDLQTFLSGNQSSVGRPRRLSDAQILEIKKLHKDNPNLTAKEIAKKYSVGAETIRRYWNK